MTANSSLLPTLFREALVRAGMLAIDEWWAGLDSTSRSEALRLWGACQESGTEPEVCVEGSFTGSEEDAAGFWHNDYYAYLVNHEMYLLDGPKFHICTRHPVAEAAVRAGRIPHDFDCPLASTDCPMRRILGTHPGRTLKLKVTLRAHQIQTARAA